ncbi:MAG TPA: response regulator transcription factor, partial [Pseudomonadota bacterium]|nr:response regulator transcription factor [Pseudomonadota bacterium]
ALTPTIQSDDLQRLTPREREVLQLIAEGHTNREIAALLQLSAKTVDTHRTSLMRKLDLHDVQGLTRFAVRRGLITSE